MARVVSSWGTAEQAGRCIHSAAIRVGHLSRSSLYTSPTPFYGLIFGSEGKTLGGLE